MGKKFFMSCYFIFLVCFNPLLSFCFNFLLTSIVIFFNFLYSPDKSAPDTLLFSIIIYIIIILLNLVCSYFISKMKINKKSLLGLPIIVLIIKILIFLVIMGYIFSIPTDDLTGKNFITIIISWIFSYVIVLDIIFFISLAINLFRRRRNERKELAS